MKSLKKPRFLLMFCAISSLMTAQAYAQSAAPLHQQTVTITAKRLSAQEKQKYDEEQVNHKIQQVIISAKRLTPQDKIAEKYPVSH